jgi:predicted O-linked N-acetylglucosamine transferase (SPINDLY family)
MRHFERSRAMCEWSELPVWSARIRALMDDAAEGCVSPFHLLSLPGFSAAEQKHCAELWMQTRLHRSAEGRALWTSAHPSRAPRAAGDRIRLGYLSGDFHEHATALLLIETIEAHNRADFEVCAYSYGADDGLAMRRRLEQAFDRFHCIETLSIEDAATLIYQDGIDILIDLKGYTQGTRSEILSYRPAPVQVAYLGYPGTAGGILCDYLITDRFLNPQASDADYSEAFAYLPHSYQPHRAPTALDPRPARADVGLPDEGFVFACFNQAWKITPLIFDVWCRLLDAVPGSRLWLLRDDEAEGSLRREALMRGVDPSRLIFAPPLPQAAHLARLQLADLALDTLPYNAHTTASDMLFAGVPLVSCPGDTFASRVAGSLLHAVGMGAFVVADLEAYYELAYSLATQPQRLDAWVQHLSDMRGRAPLFDVAAYTQALESLYRSMWSRQRAGLLPDVLG